MKRRDVLAASVWSVPVILTATAAPAAAASSVPVVPLDLCQSGALAFEALPGQEFKGNSGNGFTLVKGDGLIVHNRSGALLTLPLTFWTSAHQSGLLVTTSGDTLLAVDKDGNRASTVITMDPGTSRILRVVVDDSKAEAHLVLDCGRFVFKSVTA